MSEVVDNGVVKITFAEALFMLASGQTDGP
jgi:hypothetical protein